MVWCGVVWCGVVWCGVVWCGVICCAVLCCVVLCCVCVVLCLCCVVLCCAVLCCVVLCCVGLKALLPEGNGRDVYPRLQVNGRAVCIVRVPCVSVRLLAVRGGGGVGETWMSPTRRILSSQKFTLHSLSLRLLCRRSSYNTHAIVLLGPRRAFSNVARALAWAYHTLMDFLMT